MRAAREQDAPGGVQRRRVRDRRDATRARPAREQPPRASGPRARAGVASLRDVRRQLPDDRHHLGQPPRPVPPHRDGRPSAAVPEPAASHVRRAHPALLTRAISEQELRALVRRNAVGQGVYVLAFALAFVSAPVSLALCGLAAIYYTLPG